jgi:thioredoxin reductase (NADPH)
MSTERVIVLGSGPAGLTAALYAARANLAPLVVEGNLPGGQLTITTAVENFPGFPQGIMGPDLMEAIKAQAARFGARYLMGNATACDLSHRPFNVTVEGHGPYTAKSLIVATGASALTLGLENEQALMGHGVSTCATCDGFFFRDRHLVVVGGGDSAMEEAIFLTKFAHTVTIVHRRDQFRASKVMQDRVLDNPKIDVLWNTIVLDVLGRDEDKVTGLRLQHTATAEKTDFPCDGLFLAIGHRPNTEIFKGQLDVDDQGYIEAIDRTRTNIPGVFVAGDVHDHLYRQAITAAGSGCMAAMDCEKWLEAQLDRLSEENA